MSKLSFEALKERAAVTNQEELLNNVSGGTFGSCHCSNQGGWDWSQQNHVPLGNLIAAAYQLAHMAGCEVH